jgi:hypothetical protein
MATVSATRPQCKRFLKWHPNHDDHSQTAGAVEITDNGKRSVYVVSEFVTGLTGRGFTMTSLAGQGYTVVISDRGSRWDECQCEGWKYRRTCRHCSALRRLVEVGKL